MICCREKFGPPEDPSEAAGEWGSYLCDLPLKTFESAAAFIRDTVKPDAMIWTGDIVPHDQYNLDETEAELYQSTVSKLFHDYFYEEFPIFPIMGNHDFQNLNSEDFLEIDPMLSFDAEQWKDYLEPEAAEMLATRGFWI
jgi:hypothetical protein